MPLEFDAVRFVVGLALLGYASVRDLQVRRVPNLTWIIGGAVGVLLLGLEWATTTRLQPLHLAIILLVAGAAYLLWYFHLLAGGADAKALMALAVLLPAPLRLTLAGHVFPWWPSPLPPTLIVLVNALAAFLLAPLLLAMRNLVRGDVRFPAMFLGYVLPLETAVARFVWIAERVDDDGRVRNVYFASRWTDDEQAENVRRLREKGVARVWVTPKLPFMVPLLAGFLAAFLLGDVMTRFILEPIVGSGGLAFRP